MFAFLVALVLVPSAVLAQPLTTGCADGEREGFLTAPAIAGCAGGWSVPGISADAPASFAPTCERAGGDDGTNPAGTGCTVTDLRATGWFDCVAQRRTGSISNKYNALSGVSGSIPFGTDYIYVLGGGNAARLAGPSSSNQVARTADYGCGRAVLWGDVEFGTPSVYHAPTWNALAPWLLSGP